MDAMFARTRFLGFVGLLTLTALAGCSTTRFGKCKNCETVESYPSASCPTCMDGYAGGSVSLPPQQPAPVPAAEPMTLPGAPTPVPPPPGEALRARPIERINATTRGWYYSASTAVRATFHR